MPMDPSDPSSFNLQHIKLANGRKYRYCDQTPTDYVHGKTPVLLLMHGFPEFWYDWRYQIGPWVRRGWRVIAPDMLGYGGTDKPDDVSLYTPLSIAAEMVGLLDALDLKQPVVLVGHDWGALAAWPFAMRYTERVKALVPISLPYQHPFTTSLTVPQLVESRGPEKFGYWSFFDSAEAPTIINANDAEFGSHKHNQISKLIDICFRSRDTLCEPPFISQGSIQKYLTGEWKIDSPATLLSEKVRHIERQYYIDTFKAGGIDKPLNYYRSTPYRYEQEQGKFSFAMNHLDLIIPATVPILFMVPTGERIVNAEVIENTRPFVPSMEVVRPEGAHYIMLEKGDEVAQIIGDWLEKKFEVATSG
ncbi:hypothetical protein FRB96_003917 [Tulasnella sp. 330]|nr:hypothetical protein FRB96_003917 [Tulasnella sp. 330]